MKLEDQVVSLNLAKQLKELGVKQESLFFYSDGKELWESFDDAQENYSEAWAAFTVAELGEMLPVGYHSGKSGVGQPWICKARRKTGVFKVSETEADVRAKMLIHLLQQKVGGGE